MGKVSDACMPQTMGRTPIDASLLNSSTHTLVIVAVIVPLDSEWFEFCGLFWILYPYNG